MRTRKRYRINKTRFTIFILFILFIILSSILLIRGSADVEKRRAEREALLKSSAPVITLFGDEDMVIDYEKGFEEPGYSATDAYGIDITDKVKITKPEHINTGYTEVQYTVEDKNGNEASALRKLSVKLPPQTEEGRMRGLSVLMYHMVYDPLDPPDWPIDANMITTDALEEELQYLVENEYYFPTWEEVRRYLDGEIDLPEKSVCLTFDDGKKIFEKYGVPLIEKYDVRATAFIIGTKRGDHWAEKKDEYKHLWLGSHSYDMHKPGGHIGHGGIFTAMSYEEALNDLNMSIEQIGSHAAFAYPFGDYTEQCMQVVNDAGFLCAFTTEYGKIYPGDDPMKLRRMRVSGSPTLEYFKTLL